MYWRHTCPCHFALRSAGRDRRRRPRTNRRLHPYRHCHRSRRRCFRRRRPYPLLRRPRLCRLRPRFPSRWSSLRKPPSFASFHHYNPRTTRAWRSCQAQEMIVSLFAWIDRNKLGGRVEAETFIFPEFFLDDLSVLNSIVGRIEDVSSRIRVSGGAHEGWCVGIRAGRQSFGQSKT